MSAEHWPPTKAATRSAMEAAHLDVEQCQITVCDALALAQLYATLLMHGKTTPDQLLAALREVHDAATAMLEPAQDLFTRLLEVQQWAERVSWDVLAVPLYDTAPLLAGDVLWLDEATGGYGSGVN
jgi:hypothetical protein